MFAIVIPLPCDGCVVAGWLVPWIVAGSIALFVLTVIWAIWTVRRRRR